VSVRLARLVVRLSAAIVPSHQRDRWREEWLGEIDARSEPGAASGARGKRGVFRRSRGAPIDALALRVRTPRGARTWRAGWREDALQAMRMLRRAPAHSAVVGGCLTLGITVSVAAFSVVNGIVYGAIPGVADRSSVMQLHVLEDLSGRFAIERTIRLADFEALRSVQAPINIAAESALQLAIRSDDDSRPIHAAFVSGNYFEVLGTRAAAGRLLRVEDDAAGALLAVISHAFWQAQLAAASDVVGRILSISGQPVRIVGVAEAGFSSTGRRNPLHDAYVAIDVWLPLPALATWPAGAVQPAAAAPPVDPRSSARVDLTGRVRSDVPLPTIARLLGSAVQDGKRATRVELVPLGHPRSSTPADMAVFMAAMMAAPLVIVAIACANVANLRLVRSTARARELAIRQSLGASRTQLVRLLALESLALAAVASAAGWVGAQAVLRAIHSVVPLWIDPDLRVVLFATAILAGVTVLAGVLPALAATRDHTQRRLRQTRHGGGRRQTRLRHALVGLQVALSCGLLIVAALFLRTVQNMQHVVPQSRDLLVAEFDLSRLGYDSARAHGFADALAARLAAHSAVRNAGVAGQSLFGRSTAVGIDVPGSSESFGADVTYVRPGWFATAGLATLAGRGFDANDDGRPRAIVGRGLASLLAPTGSPVGMTVMLVAKPQPVAVEVIGVVDDYYRRPTASGGRQRRLYLPLTRTLLPSGSFPPAFSLFVRTPEPDVVRRDLARVVVDLEPRAIWTQSRTADEIVAEEVGPIRYAVIAVGALGTLALLLAATGLYAAVAYVVSLRTREIGIRMAIGARPADAVGLIVRQALRVAGIGLVAGVSIAVPVAALMRSELPGVAHVNPWTVAPVLLVLLTVTALAALVPAHRAARVDPVKALRTE
jgi:predicted permease